MLTGSAKSSGHTVDIGVPTYRRPGMLRGALASILGQSRGDFRVTVVDNASQDVTGAVVTASGDPRVHLVTNPATVPRVANYNLALAAGTAPYVALLADDDEWQPMFLARAVDALEADSTVVIVHTGYEAFDGLGRVMYVVRNAAPQPVGVVTGREYIEWLLAGTHRVEFTGTVLRRSAMPSGGMLPEDDVADDVGLLLRTAIQGRVAFLPEALARVRFHGETVSAAGGTRRGDGRYQMTLDYREKGRDAKLRFINDWVNDPAEARRLRRLVRRAFRRQLLVPAAQVLRNDRALGPSWQALRRDASHDPWVLLDPQAWKRAAAAYLGR